MTESTDSSGAIETIMSNILLQPQNIVAGVLHCSKTIIIKKKKHYQTHVKVKIVHTYSFVSRKKHKQKKKMVSFVQCHLQGNGVFMGDKGGNACMYCICKMS